MLAIARIRSGLAGLLAISAALLLAPEPGWAQPGSGLPGIDHYLVYRVAQPVPSGVFPVGLLDQFSSAQISYDALGMDFFGNPVSKNNEGIVDPILHYTWWHIVTPVPQPFSATVLVTNQFGDQTLNVHDAAYMMNPALKFPQPGQTVPVGNHYKCYIADGQLSPRTVSLQDQFGSYNAIVRPPAMYCNPADKTFQGTTEPMIRPDAHLVCYPLQFFPPFLPPVGITFQDEFLLGDALLNQQVFLCVPTLKQEVVPTPLSSWGSVKATYR